MKNIIGWLLAATMVSTVALTGCSADSANNDKVGNAKAGEVVELEGQQDQYGWFPHMRLTFDGDTLTEVYFDYVDDAGAKKSQDEEYNSTMKEKTGRSAKDAMNLLREALIETQDPSKVDIVTGATQSSVEFITMATQGFDQYKNGETSSNNYGKSDPTTNADDGSEEPDKTTANYDNGGDGSPNNPENSENVAKASGETEGAGASAGEGSGGEPAE